MANIPHKFTQEAQNERDMSKKLDNPKSRFGWAGACMKFDCANRERKCSECFHFSEYKAIIETESK